MNRISLCMIVKDEAACLPRFLEHAQGAWDELIVVDSLSTDGSQELIRKAGGIVIDRPWTEDFAAARNAALDAATGDWILVLDADEFVSPAFVRSIRAIAQDPTAGAVQVCMRNPMPNGHARTNWLLRMFRNRPEHRYRHAIHEDASEPISAMLDRESLALVRASGDIEHIGYLRERAAAKDKKNRDVRILRACIERDPANVYSWTKLLEVALFWRDGSLARNAAEGLDDALETVPTAQAVRPPWAAGMLEMLGRAKFAADPSAERIHLQHWLTHLPDSAELHFRHGSVCEALGDLAAAERSFKRCLQLESPNPQLVTVRPRVGLARLAMSKADWSTGIHYSEAALSDGPLDIEALVAWWVCAIQARIPHAIDALVDHTISRCGPTPETYGALATAAREIGLDAVAIALEDRMQPQARRAV